MKKRNFITGFSAAFVATIALVSCGGIKSKDGVVLTIGGHEYTAQELFEGQKTPAAAEAKFNAVYKVAVRRYFDEGQEGHTYMGDITRDTKLKVAGAKEEAKTNASKNGTKYKAEWEKILSSNGVDDETGLYNKFEYDLMKTKFDDTFYSKAFKKGDKELTNYDILREGGKFCDNTGTEYGSYDGIKGYLKTKQPYHMKHILVKISAADKDNTNGTIKKEEANKIYAVVSSLANGMSFEQVSTLYNDDETAKKSNGNLGIMSRDTSFVNDFKLGTYMYEAFFGSSTQETGKAYDGKIAKQALGLEGTDAGTAGGYANKINNLEDPTTSTYDGQTQEATTKLGIGQIPYGEILKFANSDEVTRKAYDQTHPNVYDGVADIEFAGKYKDKFIKNGVSEVKEKYYPRNVIFNKYFNKHNIMVITRNDAPELSIADYVKENGNDGSYRSGKKDNKINEISQQHPLDIRFGNDYLPGFNDTNAKNGDHIQKTLPQTQDVLRDENGRVILVFRSGTSSSSTSNADTYQGIHFVVIERSPFIASETDFDGADGTTLNEYYTQYYPTEINSKHPKYSSQGHTNEYKRTYANWIPNESEAQKNQKSRSDTIKTELKKADDNLNTYVYDYLISKGQINFSSTATAQNIKSSIDDWIQYTKHEATEYETKKKWNESWKNYYNSLTAQFEQRKETVVEDQAAGSSYICTRMVPEICAYAFQGEAELLGTFSLKQLFGVGGVFHD